MNFNCTMKVRKALKLRDQDLSAEADVRNEVEQWYCNLFYMDRRKCLIWMHAKTLFTVVAPGVRQDDFRLFGEIFRSRASKVLSATDGISEADIAALLDDGPDRFAKTNSASVLGSMNDRVEACKWHLYDKPFDDIDFDRVNYYLNRTPMGALGYRIPSDALRQLLTGETQFTRVIE